MIERPLRIDLHTHTCYSHDSHTSLREVVLYAKRRGLDGVAITDHNTLRGALKLLETCKGKDFIVIPGIEIGSKNGHILALNIKSEVPHGLGFQETVDLIHEAGGIAVASHPLSLFKGIPRRILVSTDGIDAIETINSSAIPFFLSKYFGRKYAKAMRLPETAGSDAHTPEMIGWAYTKIYGNSNVEDIVDAIIEGKTEPCGCGVPFHLRIKDSLKRRKG